jgi:hypothetical protein
VDARVQSAIEDGNHVVNNRIYRYRAQSGDWIAQQLGLSKTNH